MAERRHPIEQMSGLPRARFDRRARLRQRRAGVAERHTASARHEVPNQIERAIQLGRERDDADAVAGGVDFGEDVAAVKIARTLVAPVAPSAPIAPVAPIAPSGLRRQPTGCAPRYSGLMKLLSRWAGSTRAPASRLTPLEAAATLLASTSRSASGAHATVVGQNAGDAELRQSLRNRGNRVAAVERVDALEPMNVDVDETGKHDMPAQIDPHLVAPVAPIAPLHPLGSRRSVRHR